MAKAILVMNMPERCADCPLRSSEKTSYVCCYLTLKNISSTDYYDKKPDWCPLRDCRRRKNAESENMEKECSEQDLMPA